MRKADFVPHFSARSLPGAALVLLILAAAGCERAASTADGGAPPPETRSPAAAQMPGAVPRTSAAAAPPPTPASVRPAPDAGRSPALSADDPAPEPPRRFCAYYFHRTLRCPTCLAIERQARAALEEFYGGELATGRLMWQAVNIEAPGHEHFERDFDLQSQALVLVELTDDRASRWEVLPKVWELVEDPPGFQAYVVTEVAQFMAGG